MGFQYLTINKNSDGGIPSIDLKKPSGCWTTAEAIEVMIKCPFFPRENMGDLKNMLEFLITSYIPEKGWAMNAGGPDVSTMATGHAIVALKLGQNLFQNDESYIKRSNKIINEAFQWLHTNQEKLKGWGVEPEKEYGKSTRIISTCYALRGYYSLGYTTKDSNDVKHAIQYLVKIKNKDDGWGREENTPSDPANTARVLSILIQSSQYSSNDQLIINGISYILKNKDKWRFDTESYVNPCSSGQIYFHSNTLIDILEAFIRCEYHGPEIHYLFQFILEKQDDIQGFWHLFDYEKRDESITTWSTSEAIYALDMAQEQHFEDIFNDYERHLPKKWKYSLGILIITNVVQILVILNFYQAILTGWNNLTEGWKQIIIGGIVIGIIIGIVANFLTDTLKRIIKPISIRRTKK